MTMDNSSNGIFSVTTCWDLIKKAEFDIEAFQNCLNIEKEYAVINAIFDLNAIFDYLLKNDDILDEIKASAVYEFYPYDKPGKYKKYYRNEDPQKDEFQYIIRSLANNTKHFIKKEVREEYIGESGALLGDMMLGEKSLGVGFWYMVDEHWIEDILIMQKNRWAEFLERHGLKPENKL